MYLHNGFLKPTPNWFLSRNNVSFDCEKEKRTSESVSTRRSRRTREKGRRIVRRVGHHAFCPLADSKPLSPSLLSLTIVQFFNQPLRVQRSICSRRRDQRRSRTPRHSPRETAPEDRAVMNSYNTFGQNNFLCRRIRPNAVIRSHVRRCPSRTEH